MLAKRNRLDRITYNKIFKEGKILHTPLLFVKYSPSKEKTFRFSAVISKKNCPKAHDRNALRRAMYDSMVGMKEMPVSAIFILKKQIDKEKMPQLDKEIKDTLAKFG